MQITAKTWNEYITRLSRLNQKAGQLMRQYIDTHGMKRFVKCLFELLTQHRLFFPR